MIKRYFIYIATCFLIAPCFLQAHTFIVNPAISSAQINSIITKAAGGDSIIFRSGHYSINNLMILKPLVLRGENFPVLDGGNKNQIISIGSDNVTIDGFKLINTGVSDMNEISAVRIQNVSGVVVKNNILENVFFGIYCLNASRCTISNNKISSHALHELQSGNGIHCWKSDSMQIMKNYITGQRDGIYFEFVTNSTILQNISERNLRYGLHFMFSHNNLYSENTFNFNGAGVAVMYSHQVSMIKNIFSQNQGESSYGILMKDISDSRVEGNTFTKNTIGIYMEGTSRIEVSHNTFESNGWAFKIQASCADITVQKNKFTGNTFDVATNGSLVLNKFVNNYWDKYAGYDLNKDGIGDIPYRPVSLYSMIAERMPYSIMLFRSFMVMLLERTEEAVPGLTPVDLKDDKPLMKAIANDSN
jgi:nitrous oxidase accessory protein